MMKTGFIDLLRHGETEGGSRFNGSTDVALSDAGWRQLRQSVEGSGRCWDRIISSPLARCAGFAEVLATERNLPLSLDERFREMHFGLWEGRSAQELMDIDADGLTRFWQNPLENTPSGAEALEHFQQRVLHAWHANLASHAGQNVLLVTHGGVIRIILSHVHRIPLHRLMEIEAGHAVLHCLETGGHGDAAACCTVVPQHQAAAG